MKEETNNSELLIETPTQPTNPQPTNPTPAPDTEVKQEQSTTPKTEETKMSDEDLSKYSVEELQAALNAKKAELKEQENKEIDWTTISLEDARDFVIKEAKAAGRENPSFSDEFVADYRKRKIAEYLKEKEKEARKNALTNATMDQVFDWLKKVEDQFGFDLEDLPFVFTYYQCPYKLAQFCDVRKDEKGKINEVYFAVCKNGHTYTYDPGFMWHDTRCFDEFVEMYI